MSKQKQALGKGIRALLEGLDSDVEDQKEGDNASSQNRSASQSYIPLSEIEINPFQPRADFDKERLTELAESIKVHGIIQPITVRKIGTNKYQLIAGERRLRASKLAGLKEVPAFIREANDQEMLEMALIENIQRENLNAIEISLNYQRLLEECNLTQDELAERVGKQRSTVTNYLRLLKLPPEIQKGIKDKQISMGHARALINIERMADQLEIYKKAVSKGLSVREVEQLARKVNQPQSKNVQPTEKLPPAYQRVQDRLSSHLATRVQIKPKPQGRGEIVITFFSDDDLNRIMDMLDED